MDTKPNRKMWKCEKGQNLVEFALVVPMLLLIVFGIAEFGRAWMTRNILTGAAREASRLAVVAIPYGGTDKAKIRANEVLSSAGIPVMETKVDVTDITPGIEYGPVTVTVSYDFPVAVAGFIPGLNSSKIPLSSSTTMRKEYSGPLQ